MKPILPLSLLTPLSLTAAAQTSGFTEPPAILYGKVVHVDAGSSYQVNAGTLEVTLTNSNSATNSVTLTAQLSPTGNTGQFSYRLEVPQRYLPSAQRQDNDLAVSNTDTQFRFDTITINEVTASPLDSSQALFTTSFAKRAQEHRLDLKVTLPHIDSDGDGMPDWWEDANGLNKLFAGDATSDADNDGWNALQEFQNNSDPNVSNNAVIVENQKLIAPPFGRLGLFFKALDSNDAPSAIQIKLTALPAGFKIVKLSPSFNRLAVNDTFTYQDVLDGQLFIETPKIAPNAAINFEVSDSENSNVPLAIEIRPWSPLEMDVQQPAVWLSANTPPEGTSPNFVAMSTWQDSTPNNRYAYQPTTSLQPFATNSLGGGGDVVAFGLNLSAGHTPNFMYFNDSGLTLNDFTLFFRMSPLIARQFHFLTGERSLLSLSDLHLGIEPQANSLASNSITLKRNGSTTYGHSLRTDESAIISAVGSGSDVTMHMLGQFEGLYQSTADSSTLEPVIPTLGARFPISTFTADQHSDMSIGDVLLYDTKLDPQTMARIQDYLHSSLNSILWDFSSHTAAVNLTTSNWGGQIMLGGWGNDQLTGGNFTDILRGGPGADTLTGGSGKDIFQIFLDDGNDTITDFNSTSGASADRLDLSGLFAGKTGLPEQFINLNRVVVHKAGQLPTLDTHVEIDLAGDGGAPDMVITLQGQQLQNSDLPRLVSEGIFFLGDLRYPQSINIASAETKLTETEYGRSITITRSGNTAGAQDVYLGFTGSATVSTDYTLTDVIESGITRKVSFAAGETQKVIQLTPIQDVLPESEVIHVAVLPSPQTPALANDYLALNLEDAPQVKIETVVGEAQRLGKVPGVIKVTRNGDLSQPLDVKLALDGSAINGDDYEQVTPLVSFGANEQTKLINITPADHAFDKGANKIATASVVPDTTKYATLSPWSASVTLLDKFTGSISNYADWRAGLAPEFNVEGLTAGDADFIDLPFEYALGLDPSVKESAVKAQPKSYILGDKFVIEMPSRASMGDIRIAPQELVNSAWVENTSYFDHSLYSLAGDQVMHVFTSRQAVGAVNSTGIFRINFQPVTPVRAETNTNTLLGSSGHHFLNKGNAIGWVPSETGSGLTAAARENGQTSILATSINGAQTVNFDWSVVANSAATITFKVDGTTVATLSDGQANATVNYSITGTGEHTLEWTISYGAATDSELTNHALLQNLSITQPAP